jgi:hypothetical protein
MKPHTIRLLKHSARLGIRKLTIGCAHKSVPDSMIGGSVRSSVASNSIKYDGWPAVWEATKRAGLGSRGGNHNQTWVVDENKIDPGVYVFNVETRQWSRVYIPSYDLAPKSVCVQCGHVYEKHTKDQLNHCVAEPGRFDYSRSFINSGRLRGAKKHEPVVVLTLTSKA